MMILPKLSKEIVLNITEKRCSKCKQIKTIDNFIKNDRTLDGYNCRCNACRKESYQEYNKTYYVKSQHKKTIGGAVLTWHENKICPCCHKPLKQHIWIDDKPIKKKRTVWMPNNIITEWRQYCPKCNFLKSYSIVYNQKNQRASAKARYELKIGSWYKIFYQSIPRKALLEFGIKIKHQNLLRSFNDDDQNY